MATAIVSTPSQMFAGFVDAPMVFQRKDLETDGTSNSGGYVKIMALGEAAMLTYFYEGQTIWVNEGTTYATSATVTAVAAVGADLEITTDIPYDGDTVGGWVNFPIAGQSYYVELQFVDPDNIYVPLTPIKVRAVGTPAGLVTCNLNAVNDLNDVTESIKFKVRWAAYGGFGGGSGTTDEFICLYATEQPYDEQIVNAMQTGRMWEGYPIAVGFTYSDYGKTAGQYVYCDADQLDINTDVISEGAPVESFSDTDYGLLIANYNPVLDANAEYVRFNFKTDILN